MARYHILIVDDQSEVRRLLRSGLDTLQLDLQVLDVPSAEEALLILGKEQIDLLIVDYRLPGMSGLELRAHAERRTPATRLILITGINDESIKHQIAQSGVAAYFFKPIHIGLFLEEVRKCLGVMKSNQPDQVSEAAARPAESNQAETNTFAALCAQQSVLGAVLLSAQGKLLDVYGSPVHQTEVRKSSPAFLHILEQDRQLVQVLPGAAYPCHHLFSSQKYDMWVTSLEPGLVLGISLPAGGTVHKAARLIQEIERLRARIAGSKRAESHAAEITPQPAAPEMESDGVVDSKLNELLGQAVQQPIQTADIKAYWDDLIVTDQATPKIRPEIISYEEALRLGLAPGVNTA